MGSKAVALFLSLGLATTVAACGKATPDGGEEGGSVVPTNPTPTAQNEAADKAMDSDAATDTPTPEANAGKPVAKEIPAPSDAVEDTGKSDDVVKEVPRSTTDDASEDGEGSEGSGEGGEGSEGGE